MKKLILSSLLFLSISFSFGQDLDSLKVIEIPESFANERKSITVKKDSLYVFRTPDIYLVNKKVFLALESTFKSTLDKDKMTETLLNNYSKTLSRNIDLERKLKINFKSSDSLDLEIYKRTQATLSNTQRALDYTINSLGKATEGLEIIEKNTKRQRRKSAFEKVLFAIGGVGIGVLVGVSL